MRALRRVLLARSCARAGGNDVVGEVKGMYTLMHTNTQAQAFECWI